MFLKFIFKAMIVSLNDELSVSNVSEYGTFFEDALHLIVKFISTDN